MKHIFLSYNNTDKKIRQKVQQDLINRNLVVWSDDELKRSSTDNWQDVLEEKIENSSCMVVLLSPDAKSSHWVRVEITCAQENDIEIFPVIVSHNKKDAVPLSLKNYQFYDLSSNYDDGMNKLVNAIQARNVRGKPTNIDDYLIVSLSGAYSVKEELIGLEAVIYFIDRNLWRRIDFGEDVQPSYTKHDTMFSNTGDIAGVMAGEFKQFTCFLSLNSGRQEVQLAGDELVAFLRPPEGRLPNYLYTWHDNLTQRIERYLKGQRVLDERQQEIELLNEAQQRKYVEDFDEIIIQVGEWLVTEYGLEHLNHLDRLSRRDFNNSFEVDHIAKSNRTNKDFLLAYEYAKQIFSYLDRVNKNIPE